MLLVPTLVALALAFSVHTGQLLNCNFSFFCLRYFYCHLLSPPEGQARNARILTLNSGNGSSASIWLELVGKHTALLTLSWVNSEAHILHCLPEFCSWIKQFSTVLPSSFCFSRLTSTLAFSSFLCLFPNPLINISWESLNT